MRRLTIPTHPKAAPSTALTYAGGTIASAYTILVADTVAFVGDSIFNDDSSSLDGRGSPIHTTVLVE